MEKQAGPIWSLIKGVGKAAAQPVIGAAKGGARGLGKLIINTGEGINRLGHATVTGARQFGKSLKQPFDMYGRAALREASEGARRVLDDVVYGSSRIGNAARQAATKVHTGVKNFTKNNAGWIVPGTLGAGLGAGALGAYLLSGGSSSSQPSTNKAPDYANDYDIDFDMYDF
jgi:hypothetical protein